MIASRLCLLALALLPLACDSGSADPVDVRATTIEPAPGAGDIARRVEIRAVFDRDVDPRSCNPATCRLLLANQTLVAADVTYDAAARLLTMTPVQALEPLTTYRVQLANSLRTAWGAPFANATEWTFTTDDTPVWDRAAELAPGALLACEASRAGGAMAVWLDANRLLQFAHFDGTRWSPPSWTGIHGAREAAIAADAAGNVVVAAVFEGGSLLDPNIVVARRAVGEPFQLPEHLTGPSSGTTYTGLDVDTEASRILVGWRYTTAPLTNTSVREWILGVGWRSPHTTFAAMPHVHLDESGVGTVVVGFNHWVPPASTQPWCERLCVDPAGNLSECDPRLAPPNSPAFASRARFGDDQRILAAQTTEETDGRTNWLVTRTFEWRSLVGWQPLPGLLGSDATAGDIAIGPGTLAALSAIAVGQRPVVWSRLESDWNQDSLGSSDEPAPPNPTTAVVITPQGTMAMLWTSAVDNSPGAPVRLLASQRPAPAAWGEPLVVDGPFAPEQVPVQTLRAVAVGTQGAVAVWSRGGTVRYSALR